MVARVLEGAPDVPDEVTARIPRDVARAASLYDRACELGGMGDCVRLAELHEEGVGVPKDLARAAALYRKACDSGDKDLPMTVCSRLAALYESGSGVPRDIERAALLYEHGCRQAMALDCESLRRGCQAGHASMCRRLKSPP